MNRGKREVVTVDAAEIEALIKRIQEDHQLKAGDRELTVRLLGVLLAVITVIQSNRATINRLRRLLAGKHTQSETEQAPKAPAESAQREEAVIKAHLRWASLAIRSRIAKLNNRQRSSCGDRFAAQLPEGVTGTTSDWRSVSVSGMKYVDKQMT